MGTRAAKRDPERTPQRLHVVLDPLALLAQLGHGAGPLSLPGPCGLDRRGARDPSGRRGVGASSRGCRQHSGPWN
ncbi:hypothetical protein AV530_010789 [Patagioenas fasciata monilis]|uniref:Uncharacterized protein n=1 Tax=Patagioenas fasciata monilis TaxID=372326 RepID=A0A1V4K7Q7_PATFA|nr:hypothetical protein AV530_010789 [Patagioenas fasciata monilis]